LLTDLLTAISQVISDVRTGMTVVVSLQTAG